MKKKVLTTSVLAVFALVIGLTTTHENSKVSAAELVQQDTKEVEAFTPITNGPLHKYVSNVYRYSGWSTQDAMSLFNSTPSKVYYNDGSYSGYLYRKNTWMEHNFKTNKNRWVSDYAGNVRLISRGLVPNN